MPHLAGLRVVIIAVIVVIVVIDVVRVVVACLYGCVGLHFVCSNDWNLQNESEKLYMVNILSRHIARG